MKILTMNVLLLILMAVTACDDQSEISSELPTGDDALIERRLAEGLDPDSTDQEGRTLLELAVRAHDHELVEALLESGADPNVSIEGYPILITDYGLLGCDIKMSKLFLNKGADPESSDQSGYITALDAAVLSGNLDCVRAVLDAGADVNRRNAFGETSVHLATAHGRLEILSELIARGAETRTRSDSGRTPLYVALRLNQFDAAELLIREGASCHDKAPDGSSLIDIVADTLSERNKAIQVLCSKSDQHAHEID